MVPEVTWQSNPPEKLLNEHFHISTGYNCRTCGQCRASNFPQIKPQLRIFQSVMYFLEEGFLPSIEKRSMHHAGWLLSYHNKTLIGQMVRTSKYEGAGPFPQSLVSRAVEVVRTRYPLEIKNGIVGAAHTLKRVGFFVK